MKAIHLIADMGPVSVNEGIPSFRIKSRQEPTAEQLYELTSIQRKELKILIEPQEGVTDVLKLDGGVNGKSQSKKIRDRIWVYWDAKGRPGEFDDFYFKTTNGILDLLSQKIDAEKGY